MRLRLNTSNAFHNKDRKPGRSQLAFGDSFSPDEKTPAEIAAHLLAGEAITACHFKGNSRTNETFLSGQLIAVDLDDAANVSVAQALEIPFIRDFAFVVYPSASSKIITPKNPNGEYRTRVFFALSEPITDRETYRLYARAIMAHLGLVIDESSVKPAQPWFGSTNRPEQPYTNFEAVLPLATVEALAAPLIEAERVKAEQAEARRRSAKPVDPASPRAEKYAAATLENILHELETTTSNRNNTLFRLSAQLMSYALGGWPGITPSVVENEITAIISSWENPRKTLATMHNGFKAATAEPLALPENTRMGKMEFIAPDDIEDLPDNRAAFEALPNTVQPAATIEFTSASAAPVMADPTPDYFTGDTPPHGFLTLLLNYDPDGALPFYFITRAIHAGLLNPQNLTHQAMQEARKALENVPSYDTVHQWFGSSRALSTILEFNAPVLEDSLGATNSNPALKLRSTAAILADLMHRARLEGLQQCYPEEAGAIAPFDTRLLRAIGCANPGVIADAIEQVRNIVDRKLVDEQSRAGRKLARYLEKARQYAACREVIPLEGMPILTTADLRAAMARALKISGLAPKPTKSDWMWELGIRSKEGVDSVLERAGISQREDIQKVELDPLKSIPQQLRQYAKQHRAKVLHLELVDKTGKVVRTPFFESDQQVHAAVCDHAMTGGTARAIFQLPNETSLTELPPRKPRTAQENKEAAKSSEKVTEAKKQPGAVKVHGTRPEVYPGEVDPDWLREHQIRLLFWLGWKRKEGRETVFINPKTEQRAPENASIAELLALLSGRDVSEVIGANMKPEFTTRVLDFWSLAA